MKLVVPDELRKYPHNHQRFFSTGAQSIASGAVWNASQAWKNFTVEEDELLVEIGIFIGVTGSDDAGNALEGAVNVSNKPVCGIQELEDSVNPIVFAHKDLHEHLYTVGAAGGYALLWNGWERFQYNGHLWLWQEDDVVFLNGVFSNGTSSAPRGVHASFYIVTAQRPTVYHRRAMG